jgi:P27 family predicted phage terminase small subunit
MQKATPAVMLVKGNKTRKLTKKDLAARSKAEPKTTLTDLVCPAHLKPAVKKEWDTLVGLYATLSSKLIADLDKNALEIYCEAMIQFREAMEHVHKEKAVDLTSKGEERVNPWFRVAIEATSTIKRYGEMLLLDPISRARAGLAKSKEEELAPMAKLLMGGRPD